jgi:UV DNA damage endonuclease
MRIGYPCINLSIGCRGNHTFRLKSYSEKRLIETVEENLKMLNYNVKHNILFFRITSDLIPFASHPICRFNWQKHFRARFKEIGKIIKTHLIRISMHPDQFVLINSLDEKIFKNSLRELIYHAEILDLMDLDTSEKIQLHVGGVYGDKEESMKRFTDRYRMLDKTVKRRLVIENDDRNYNTNDCLQISGATGIPVLFDLLHHEVNNSGDTVKIAFKNIIKTWTKSDGIPMVDYSSKQSGKLRCKHAESIDLSHFKRFLEETKPYDFDLMLEIKDKEKSALKAIELASYDGRFKNI